MQPIINTLLDPVVNFGKVTVSGGCTSAWSDRPRTVAMGSGAGGGGGSCCHYNWNGADGSPGGVQLMQKILIYMAP